jgi:hypothetical protein
LDNGDQACADNIMTIPKRGGARPGAGRKPNDDGPKTYVTVSLTPEQIAFLDALGNGRPSVGIQRLIAIYQAEHRTTSDDTQRD